jgi:hypothetical protein
MDESRGLRGNLVNFATTQAIQTLLESDEDLFRILFSLPDTGSTATYTQRT